MEADGRTVRGPYTFEEAAGYLLCYQTCVTTFGSAYRPKGDREAGFFERLRSCGRADGNREEGFHVETWITDFLDEFLILGVALGGTDGQ